MKGMRAEAVASSCRCGRGARAATAPDGVACRARSGGRRCGGSPQGLSKAAGVLQRQASRRFYQRGWPVILAPSQQSAACA
ncbi:hypothetical protein Bamb_6100 [Burkholderia ambifaria AMMD]|uniref:Uncharacterized protein n=1 Tax=Burkholderia ambifaria (strain ATCC BAA-244 / DSM 16087 / CCUG 44356 / LMG 19182 / AMMD) TaxID=339670 RepID=Q0B2H9_BURCM|nr:hypothetical protein Bamb_6100 [Burkholderia ambifaria AMMD]